MALRPLVVWELAAKYATEDLTMQRPLRLATCFALLLLLAADGPARGQDATPTPGAEASAPVAGETDGEAPAPAESAAPPVPPRASKIAERLQSTSAQLRQLHGQISEDKGVEEINRAFPPLKKRLDHLNEEQDELLEPHSGLKTLHDIENEWKDASVQLKTWTDVLTEAASKLDEILASLQALIDEWSLVKERADEDDLPDTVVQRVDTTLQELSATEDEVRTRRANVLELQNAVSEETVDVATVLDLVDQARRERQERLLSSERPPLWAMFTDFDLKTPVWRQIFDEWVEDAQAIAVYARDHWEPFAWQLLLTVAVAFVVGSLDRQSRRTSFQDPALAAAARVLRRPLSAAILISALATPWLHPLAPRGLLEFVGLAIIPPVYRLLPDSFRDRRDGALAFVAALYLFGSLAGQVDRASDVHRVFMFVEASLGLVVLHRFFRPAADRPPSIWSFLLRIGRRILILGLAVAIFGNLVGSVGLSDLFTTGFLNAGFMAALLYAAVRVLEGVMIMLPRTGALGTIDLVRRNAPMFARRGIGLVRLGAVVVWAGWVLRFFQIREQFTLALSRAMSATWQIGSLELSAGNLLVFIVAITLTIATARSLQFILRYDILPKLDLPKGVPGAISSATQYTVLGLGFLVSLAVAGVDLGSIALVAGGLGVGIGFGLQNIVNNFVSGLILLFERPVRDGDFIQAATTFGEVKRIGFRSSTIRTFFGAEVIVPNADLISSNVTNWTLSDANRNQELPVRAAYGGDPQQIIDLLVEVAAAHENTLEDPPPNAFFLAFGENTLEFSLRFWTRFDVGFSTRSAVAVAVERALREAGLAAPVPHRVVRLAREPPDGSAA